MKIGIFTFHCVANYGAVLQAYCLQEVLKGLGHDVFIIDYRPKYLLEYYKAFSYSAQCYKSFLSKCRGWIRACLIYPIRWKRNKVFSKFINCHLNLYNLDLEDESNDFDAFVFGSDQIWNPKITKGFDKIYLGDFPAAKGKKLIAYAASAGSVLNFSNENVEYFFSRIKCFDKVLVREKSLANYIKEYGFINAETVLDPMLLAGRTILDNLLIDKKSFSNKNYLMLFQLIRDSNIAKYSFEVAKNNNLKFVELISMGESVFNRRIRQTLSIEDLLAYFEKASYIITSSFHGTVMSIIFNKQFNTVSVNKSIDERAFSLLDSLGLSSRMIKINNTYSIGEVLNFQTAERLCELQRMNNIILLKSIL